MEKHETQISYLLSYVLHVLSSLIQDWLTDDHAGQDKWTSISFVILMDFSAPYNQVALQCPSCLKQLVQ